MHFRRRKLFSYEFFQDMKFFSSCHDFCSTIKMPSRTFVQLDSLLSMKNLNLLVCSRLLLFALVFLFRLKCLGVILKRTTKEIRNPNLRPVNSRKTWSISSEIRRVCVSMEASLGNKLSGKRDYQEKSDDANGLS